MINKSDRKAIFEGMKLLFFYKKNIIVVYIIMFVGLLLSLVQPQLWGRLFEKISKLQINKDIYMLLLIVFFLSILSILFDGFQIKLLTYIKKEISQKIECDMLTKFIDGFGIFVEKINRGEVLSRINSDAENISNILVDNFVTLIFIGFKNVLTLFLMMYINPLISSVTLLTSILLYKYSENQKKILRKLFFENAKLQDEYMVNVDMVVEGVWEIRNLGVQNKIKKILYDVVEKKYNSQQRTIGTQNKFQCFMAFFNQLQQISVLFVGIFFMNKNLLSFQNMIAYISYANMYSESLSEICNINVNVQNLCNSYQRIIEFYKCIENDNNIMEIKDDYDELKIKNISFGYEENLILKNVSAIFKKKHMNFIIGRSGVGKTTLLLILSGFLKQYQGDIYINKKKKKNVERLQDVVYISQNPFFLNDTIINNLLVVNHNNSIQHIYELCKRMNIYNDIVNMNEGFSTILYNNASNLSVGQRQRLALVRAMLIKPKILLCDEIIANIDQNSREIIMSFLRSKIDKMLIIFVTHQLSIISDYDILLEIKNDGGGRYESRSEN